MSDALSEAEARITELEGALERIEQYAGGIGHVHKPALELIAAEAREALNPSPRSPSEGEPHE